MEERYEIKVNELRGATCKIEYESRLNQRWERVRGGRRNGEGLRRQSWRWEREYVGQGKLGKERGEKGVNSGVRK